MSVQGEPPVPLALTQQKAALYIHGYSTYCESNKAGNGGKTVLQVREERSSHPSPTGTGPLQPLCLPIVLFVYEVVPCPECHQAGIICWCWDGDGASAADIGVAELIGEDL